MSRFHPREERTAGTNQRPPWLAAGLIVAAVVLAYANGLSGPFLFDDVATITANPTIRDFAHALIPPSDRGLPVTGRPVVNFSLAVNYAFGGLEPWGYHIVNVLLHAIAALLLFGIVRRSLERGANHAMARRISFLSALIWAVHPLQTAAVTYTVQRAEVLVSLFLLLTLYAFVRDSMGDSSRGWFGVSIVACLLGMASKEVMVSAPVLVFFYDRAFVAGRFREAWRLRRWYYGLLAGTWLMLVALMWNAGGRAGTAGFGLGIPWWAYLLKQCDAIVHYWRLALWPAPLVFDYGGMVLVRSAAKVLPQALVLFAVVASVAWALWRRPKLGFLGLWFFAIIAPTLSFVPLADTMFEHRMYLPIAAIIVLAVVLGTRWFGRHFFAVVVGLVVGLGALTVRRNSDYRSELALWHDTITKRPASVRAHYTYGTALFAAGRADAAIEQYRIALNLKPDSAEAHNDLGNALTRTGHPAEAIPEYEAAIQAAPSAEAHNNLGNAFMRLGRPDEARVHFETALRLRPEFADAHNNFGNLLAQSGNFPEAARHYEAALRVRPDLADAHANLGNVQAQGGRLPEAIAHYEAALRLRPDFADAHFNLATALAQMRRWSESAAHYEEVLRLRPDYPRAQEAFNSVRAQALSGK